MAAEMAGVLARLLAHVMAARAFVGRERTERESIREKVREREKRNNSYYSKTLLLCDIVFRDKFC
jgi:hypothetical protein